MRAMPTIDVLRQSVSSALVIASRQWRRTSHDVIAGYNVSEACATPLLIAARLDAPVRQVALAELTGIEGPSLVRLLDQLCAANLVRLEVHGMCKPRRGMFCLVRGSCAAPANGVIYRGS